MSKNVATGLSTQHIEILAELARTIQERRSHSSETSYTARLLHSGALECAKKFGEESFELALAAVSASQKEICAEASDVFYHLLVLLEVTQTPLAVVLETLAQRIGTSGLTEKAQRKKG